MKNKITFFVASSSIALHAFERKIKLMSSVQHVNIYLISSSSRAGCIDFPSTNIFVASPNYKSLFFNPNLFFRIKNLLVRSNASSIVFYDYALDPLCFIVAKASLQLSLSITIDPVAPVPTTRSLDPSFIEYILSLALRFSSFPVSLYTFKPISSNDKIESYLRLSHPRFTILEYQGIQYAETDTIKIASDVKFVYIEGCESELSRASKNLIHILLDDISLFIHSKIGSTLFIKDRPFGGSSIQNNDTYNFSFLDSNNLPCEAFDFSGITLLTIASFGALSRFECNVISLIHIISQLVDNPSDKRILNSQFAYAKTFNHPQIYYPTSLSQLLDLI